MTNVGSSLPEVLLWKDVLKICSKFTDNTHAEVYNFKVSLPHGWSVNLLYILNKLKRFLLDRKLVSTSRNDQFYSKYVSARRLIPPTRIIKRNNFHYSKNQFSLGPIKTSLKIRFPYFRSIPSRVFLCWECSHKFTAKKQLYWSHTSAWFFSCEFVAYFQNIFL